MYPLLLAFSCAPSPLEAGHLPDALAVAPTDKSVGSTSTTLDHAETGRFAVVGDVDADGDDDLVALSGGAALVYLGDPAGIGSTAERTLLGVFGEGAVVAALGDVNGDGYDDLAAASYQRSGDWSLSVFYGEP